MRVTTATATFECYYAPRLVLHLLLEFPAPSLPLLALLFQQPLETLAVLEGLSQAVGPLQFDVVKHRMEQEFRAPVELAHLDYTLARRTDAESAPALHGLSGAEVLKRRLDGELLVLVHNKWRLRVIERENPDLFMEPLLAGGVEAS